ncbi:hypothetical protein AAE478_004515 [Parahypoxylon ruwenzoriense]
MCASEQNAENHLDPPKRTGWHHELQRLTGASGDAVAVLIDLLHLYDETGNETTVAWVIEMAYSDDLDKGLKNGQIVDCKIVLSELLRKRYERRGAVDDLCRGVILAEQVNTAVPDDPGYLATLGALLKRRYDAFGDEDDLTKAIECFKKSFKHGYGNNRTSAAMDLSYCLLARFERKGRSEDIVTGIELATDAVSTMRHGRLPVSKHLLASRLNILSVLWGRHYEFTKDVTALYNAGGYSQECLETDPFHPQVYMHLANMANWLAWRYRCNPKERHQDLDDAIDAKEKAINRAPAKSPFCTEWQGELCKLLGWKYRESQQASPDLLDKAVIAGKRGLKTSTPGSVAQLRVLHNLSEVLMMRYGKTNSKRDFKLAIALWKRVVFSRSFHPLYTVNAAVEAVEILKEYQEYKAALKMARGAIPILGEASPRSIQAFDQQRILERYDGLASDAAALTLECRGDEAASTAVSLLEQGRGILADHRYHSRSDLPPLKAERDLDKAIGEIQKRPVFKYFLGHQLLDELYKVAETRKQAIVIVNVSFRCDALIIHTRQTKVVQLKALSKADITQRVKSWATADATGCDRILRWLWDSIASPILSALEMMHPPIEGNPWPRICWILTSALCRLPLHAAGYHEGVMDNTVLNRAISSYSATGKALVYSHQNKVRAVEQAGDDPARRKLGSALLVSMPTTSGMRSLPGAQTEVEGIRRCLNRISPLTTVTSLSIPNREEVLERLTQSQVFHFAGHGVLDKRDVSKSALMMSDGPLTVADLLSLELHTRPPLLAYLSACSTGIDGSSRLFDENMHLVAACQIAGFQNVIGTFWKVQDHFCTEIALEVYKQLYQKPEMALSEALHIAVQKGRDFKLEEEDESTMTSRDGVPDMDPASLEIEDPRSWAAYFIAGVD